MSSINAQKFDCELKKGGAELLVLSLLEARPRHGYEVRGADRDALGRRAQFQRRLALPAALPAGETRLDRRPLPLRRPGSGGGAITN
ncbi:MAG: hypothetical protein ACREEM_10235 [Blastocatellia bacterium]